MMGDQRVRQEPLCSTSLNLAQRVRVNPPLRQSAREIDFDFVYEEVANTYGTRGTVSVPPAVLLKLRLLVVLYHVRAEREVRETMPERVDWLGVLGYALATEIPNPSVLSKARRRWGPAVFPRCFERRVGQWVEAGRGDGRKIFVAASLVEAHAANRSLVATHSLKRYLNLGYPQLAARLEAGGEPPAAAAGYRKVKSRYVSSTEPEAASVRRGQPKGYSAVPRGVDGRSEISTATEVTAGAVNAAQRLLPVGDRHHHNTHRSATTVVADSK
jgi:transposase